MRVLLVVPYAPNAIRVRPYHLIRALAARGHRVTVATLWSSPAEQADLAALGERGVEVVAVPLPRWRSLANCAGALPTGQPLQAHYCWTRALARGMMEAMDALRYDAVHVEHLRGAPYGLRLKAKIEESDAKIPVVWDSVDCISYLFAQAAQHSGSRFGRWMTRLELGRTRRYEGRLVGQFDRVLVTSAVDKRALGELAREKSQIQNPECKISILPNGVDLDYYTPGDGPREPAVLVFTGKMSYHANVTAALLLAREILPLVWRERPEVRLWIVGKDPPGEVRRVAAGEPRIEVTGTVPDLRPYLRRATLAAAPMVYGAGIQNKVLEAMACRAPVVASPQACLALQARAGEDLAVADGAEAFAEAVVALLADGERRDALGRAGRRYVEVHHEWAAAGAQLEAEYQAAIEAKYNGRRKQG